MKIKASTFYNFVKKTSLNGDIDSILYVANEEGIKSLSKSRTGLVIAEGVLKKEAFVEYDDKVRLPIKDSKILMNCIAPFKDSVIELLLVDNDITINGRAGNRNINVKLKAVQEKYIDSTLDSVPSGLSFAMEPTAIDSDIFSLSKVHATMLRSSRINIETKEGKIALKIGDTKFDSMVQTCDWSGNDFNVTLGSAFLEIAQIFDKEVMMMAE